MTPDERRACLAALEAAEQAAEALRAVLHKHPLPKPDCDELVPLAVAYQRWNVSKDTGLKRVRRGAGRKVGCRWFVPASALTNLA